MTDRWPAMMKRTTAAEYCDLSVPSFEREIIEGRLPPGVVFGGREHWHRAALDRALARIAGFGDDGDDIGERLRERYAKKAA